MKNSLLIRYCMAILVLLSISCSQDSKPKKSKFNNIARAMEREYLMAHDPYLKTVPTHRLIDAKVFRDQKLQVMQMNRLPVPGIFWEERGPQNIGGRTRAIIFDLADEANGYKKVWAAGVSGGLWRCNDITAATPIWTKQDDLFDNLAVSSIIQDPEDFNIMYFGTGEGWFNVDAVQGAGIWKTTDGGNTWNRLPGTANFFYVQDLALDANGHLYASTRNANGGGQSGLVKSSDGGSSWSQALTTPVASSNRAADIEVAANGDVYVSMGTTGSNGGIYRSSFAAHGANTGNAGTWVNITPNAAGIVAAPSNLWSRIELACAPSDPDRVYAVFQGFNSDDCSSIQQYNAATNSWTVRTVPNIIDQGNNSKFTRGQAFYNLIAAVDPNDEDVLYLGGVDGLRSLNGGASWTQMTSWSLFSATGFNSNQQVHADHHAIVYAPMSSSRILWGTDGGVYYTENGNITGTGNKPTFRAKNNGYNVTQYYSAAIHPSSVNYFLGGTQDNGTHRFSNAGMNNATEVTGGDGGFCFIDEDNPDHQITSYTYNNYHVSSNGGNSFSSRSWNDFGLFINPADYSSSQNILYAGHKTGNYFRWSTPHSGTSTQDSVRVTAFGNAMVTHVKTSALTPNTVFFGLQNGSVVMVEDAQTGTTKPGTVIKTGLGTVSCIVLDPVDENHMLVTYSNFGVNSIFESFNALSASPVWTSIEGDLPDMPVRWAMFDPRNSDWVILATELGVWSTNDLNGTSTEWSPTNSGLANVRVDMLKMRASDQTLLAATHGRGMFSATIPTVTTADINFASSNSISSELSGETQDCRSFQDITFSMTIANAPAGDAEVELSVISSTATQGVDFDFTTNGNFETPSTTIIFEDGSSEAKQITVRIFNDSEVEGQETITFGYNLSEGSDAQPGIGSQEHILTINDNDVLPIAASNDLYIIGTGTFYQLSNSSGAPLNAGYTSQKSNFLYRAEELSAAGIHAGNIHTLGLYLLKNSTRPIQNLQIKLGTTTLDNIIQNGQVSIIGTSTVFSASSYTTVDEWNDFSLDVPFEWNGSDNIVVEVCYQNATADSSQLSDIIIGYADGSGATDGNFFWQDNRNCGNSFTTLSGGYYGGYKPLLLLGVDVTGTEIASGLSSKADYLAESNDLYIYNNSGELMARIWNQSSSQLYGCFDIEIDRAGTGSSVFWNNETANRVMDKTLLVTPENNFEDGSYEITLYYTPEEVEGWESETGQSFDNIQLIKTKGSVSDITPSTPGATGDVEIVTPIKGFLGEVRTLTFTFNSGFSGFAAGIVGDALPVELLEFNAKPLNGSVVLDWKTASEQNSRGFEIEKSPDGQTFANIGFIASAGNSSTVKQYAFTDRNVWEENNYYRLRQVDLDGRFTYSKVVMVKMPVSRKSFRIMQNPVRDIIDIRFNAAPNSPVEARLTDINGRVVMRWNVQQQNGAQLRLQVPSGKITRGMYILHLRMNGKDHPERIIIQ